MQLKFETINKFFGDFQVLRDVSFSIESGEIFGYLGRNGAGKTTSIRILMNVFGAHSGSILIDGKPFDPAKYRIGYLPEERGMYAKSKIREQLVYFAMLRGADKASAEKSVAYWAKRFEIEQYLDKPLETLSKGNQQKVQITQAFLNEPDILILDEPFSGLDPVNSKVFQDALVDYAAENRFIIFSSHQMSYVETFCDRIAIIDKGKIVLEGQLGEIKRTLGENKVRVSLINTDAKTLQEFLESAGYESDIDGKGCIVTLGESQSKKTLLAALIDSNYEVHQFGDYEPSLQEIFIQKVGDNHA